MDTLGGRWHSNAPVLELLLRAILNLARLHTRVMNYHNDAGALLFIAGVVAIMGIVTPEATYPGYNTHTNSQRFRLPHPLDNVAKQPAATIFAVTLITSTS